MKIEAGMIVIHTNQKHPFYQNRYGEVIITDQKEKIAFIYWFNKKDVNNERQKEWVFFEKLEIIG